jgi:hypothetical protein
MRVSWFGGTGVDGQPGYDANQLQVPGRYNFAQAAIYRLKLTNIPNQDLVLYPTLEIVPASVKTATFLAHSSVPIAFTDEDFAQVKAGNFVVKVIYLPDPQYQDLATAGPSEVVSTRLEPGADPIAEACKRGSILAVIRMGNIDLEAANTPGMDAPAPFMGGNVPPGAIKGVIPPVKQGAPVSTSDGSSVKQMTFDMPTPAPGTAKASDGNSTSRPWASWKK